MHTGKKNAPSNLKIGTKKISHRVGAPKCGGAETMARDRGGRRKRDPRSGLRREKGGGGEAAGGGEGEKEAETESSVGAAGREERARDKRVWMGVEAEGN